MPGWGDLQALLLVYPLVMWVCLSAQGRRISGSWTKVRGEWDISEKYKKILKCLVKKGPLILINAPTMSQKLHLLD